MVEDDAFVVYDRCFSPASWTIPSHASFFTGLYPREHNVGNEDVCLPDNLYCLAEILKYMGYATYGVTSNGLVSSSLNFHRGFDEFHEMWHLFNSKDFFEINRDFLAAKKDVKSELGRFFMLLRLSSSHRDYAFLLKKFIDSIYRRRNGIRGVVRKSAHSTRRTINTAKKIVNVRNAQSPFFLFLNIMETHNQYNPPPKFSAFKKISPRKRHNALKEYDWHHYALSPFTPETFEILNILYDGEVLFLDSVLWDFYSFLKNKGILDNTVLIIASDHGELLGERGLLNHMFTLYNELLHVPLLIKFPKDFVPGGRRDVLVQLHDIFATIADMAGSPLPMPDSSHSLLSSAPRKIAYSQLLSCDHVVRRFLHKNPSFVPQAFMQPQSSLITDDMMKLIKRADGHAELYDLKRDLYETRDLSENATYAQQKETLLQLLGKSH